MLLTTLVGLTACGGGGSSSPDGGPDIPVENPVTLSGQISFDRVPHQSDGVGLDYSSTYSAPARWVEVVALDADNNELASAQTDSQGRYQLQVPPNSIFHLEALARSVREQTSLRWDVEVRNGRASGDPVYRLIGDELNSGSQNLIIDLHAASGWDGSSYSEVRSAAPFAILDSVGEIHRRMLDSGVELNLGSLDMFWSTANQNGSFYRTDSKSIEIAGRENRDTDEFDEHVIIHEWWHYFEHQISRGDVIGGSHSLTVPLELRTAFSEGFGNAWASIILEDPLYRDANGAQQSNGFTLDVEDGVLSDPGWHNEGSVHQVIYDLMDSANEAGDFLALDLGELLSLLMSPDYRQQPGLTGIHSFGTVLANQLPDAENSFSLLLDAMEIQGRGYFASAETGQPDNLNYALPIYREMRPDDPPLEFCVHNQTGEYNRVQNRQLVRLVVDLDGQFFIRLVYADVLTRSEGGLSLTQSLERGTEADPQFRFYLQGEQLAGTGLVGSNLDQESVEDFGSYNASREERGRINLTAGQYVVEIYDQSNVDLNLDSGGLGCFTFSVIRET